MDNLESLKALSVPLHDLYKQITFQCGNFYPKEDSRYDSCIIDYIEMLHGILKTLH